MKAQKNTCFHIIYILLVFSGSSLSLKAQGNLVFNGGFDTGASGWSLSSLGIGGGWRDSKGNPGGYFNLDATPSPLDPTISQSISNLTPGATYVLSGQYQYAIDRGGGNPTELSFRVSMNGVSLFEAATPVNLSAWNTFSVLYSATSSTASLSLASQINGTGISYGIDNMSLKTVPEPSSVVLLCYAGIFLAVKRLMDSKRID